LALEVLVLAVDQSQLEAVELVESLVELVEPRQAFLLRPKGVLQVLEAMVVAVEDLVVEAVVVGVAVEAVAEVVALAEVALELAEAVEVLVVEAEEAPQLTFHNGSRICKAA
jgi:hypothetical protein